MSGKPFNKRQKEETFKAMIYCTLVSSEESFWATFQPRTLTKEQVESAIAPFRINWRDSDTPSLTDGVIIQNPFIAARCPWAKGLILLWPSVDELGANRNESVKMLVIDVQNEEQLNLISHRVRALKMFFASQNNRSPQKD